MTDYSAIAKTISDSLRLRVAPIAVCLTNEAPAGVPGPTEPAAAGCVFWERGAQGAFVTTSEDHSNCAVGMYTCASRIPNSLADSRIEAPLRGA